jgi:hypothetical protein
MGQLSMDQQVAAKSDAFEEWTSFGIDQGAPSGFEAVNHMIRVPITRVP